MGNNSNDGTTMARLHNAKHEARDKGDNNGTDLTGTVTGMEGKDGSEG